MEPEARYTIVGVVVLVLGALLAGFIFWLYGSGMGTAVTGSYLVYLRHASVEGLEARSPVTMRGIRVGTVTGLRFSPREPDAIEVAIATSSAAPVLDSTRATISRNLFTGLASVQLTNAGTHGRSLRPQPGRPLPVIAEGESAEQQMLDNVAELAKRANQLLSPENQAAIAQTLANAQLVSAHADRSLAKVDTALESLTHASGRIAGLAGNVARDGHALASRYERLGMQATVAMHDASDTMRDARASMNQISRRTDTVLRTAAENMQDTTEALRDTADSVSVAADRLHEPAEVVYGPAKGSLGPGERRR